MDSILTLVCVAVSLSSCASAVSSNGTTGTDTTKAGITSLTDDQIYAACFKSRSCSLSPDVSTCAGEIRVAGQLASFYKSLGMTFELSKWTGIVIGANATCINTATTCDGVAACILGTSDIACTGNSAGCSGSVLWQCKSGRKTGSDCALIGLPCNTLGGKGAACTRATPCTTIGTVCNGTTATACFQFNGTPMSIAVDCAGFGDTCRPGTGTPEGLGACMGTGSPCTDTSKNQCNGSILTSCLGGALSQLDCSVSAGWVCGASNAQADKDCVLAPACATTDTCSADGKKITFCDSGKSVTFDCGAHGLKCVQTGTSANCGLQ